MLNITINDKKIQASEGKTILEVANENGIKIPNLCHDEKLHPYGACRICVVQVTGRNGFVTACNTQIAEGMEIQTHSEAVIKARQTVLRLLLSDHFADCVAPCQIACPAGIDVPAYIAAIANGQFREAVKIIKEKSPMPLSIGRVCPAFCEKECRRTLVENPIAIRQLKRYCADMDLNDSWQWIPEKQYCPHHDEGVGGGSGGASLPKKVAIIGGGPSGLTCGYYLSINGYDVDIFEASPKAGGWLRYGIPEYRLPKEILDKEIELMCSLGMKIHTNKTLGKDIFLSQLSKDYDAVYLAVGASKAVDMPVKQTSEGRPQTSENNGDITNYNPENRTPSTEHRIYLGVDYLKSVALGNIPPTGKKCAVIGGGNTAIDCARTALRLGSDVTIIYRRTRAEMPADEHEITAADAEGVKFMPLANPVEYILSAPPEFTKGGVGGGLQQIVIELMELGEPDSSGRRKPVPTGRYETHEFDSVIAAISQIPDVDFLAEEQNQLAGQTVPISKWKTAVVDEKSMYSGVANVFAGGDFRRGPATAIEAIADGKVAAESIDKYLQGLPLHTDTYCFDSKKAKTLADLDPAIYKHFDKIPRVKSGQKPYIAPTTSVGGGSGGASSALNASFFENELTYTDTEAIKEANRCLECPCKVNETCTLREYATEYEITPDTAFAPLGVQHQILDPDHPFIARDQNKCIKCGKCYRVCDELRGIGVFTAIDRGVHTVIDTPFGRDLDQTKCDVCGECISACPTGALTAKHLYRKPTSRKGEISHQHCGLCGYGCEIEVETVNTQVKEIRPNTSLPLPLTPYPLSLCFYGRFGWQIYENPDRPATPMIKSNGVWKSATLPEIKAVLKQKLTQYKDKYAFISAESSLEEMLLFKEIEKHQSIKLTAEPIDTETPISTYPNATGLKHLNIPTQSPTLPDSCLIINYKAGTINLHTPHSTLIDIDTIFDPNTKADIYIPAPTYLEIEAHTINDFGQICLWKNPKKSNIFHILLNILYEADFISPAYAEPSLWNALAEEVIQSVDLRQQSSDNRQKIADFNPQTLSSRHKKLMKEVL